MFSSFSYSNGSSQGIAVGTVELKGRGVVNLVAVLEFERNQKESKIYKTDEYSKFLEHIKSGSRSVALKVLLEKSTIEPSDIKVIRTNIETAVPKYISLEAKRLFPSDKVEVGYSVVMLYISDPLEQSK
jgi:hypothetical protein